MTTPIDITDPRVVKAYAHPLRIHILTLLNNRVASPSEIAQEVGAPLSNTSYHVRQLAALGLLELVNRVPRRGAIEHYYTATVRPTITDEGWAKLPEIVKRATMLGGIEKAIGSVVTAAEEGGFNRDDIHFSRTEGRLDAKGWKAVSRELAKSLERIDRILAESAARVEEDPETHADDATVLMLHFAGPSPKARRAKAAEPKTSVAAAAARAVSGSTS